MSQAVHYLYNPPAKFIGRVPQIVLSASRGKLIGLNWHTPEFMHSIGNPEILPKLTITDDDHVVIFLTIKQLDEYFAKTRQRFDIPIDLSQGTPFSQQVWQALQTIEYGTTISYANLAQAIGKPTAYRACANANGRNPISIIVPCHRVIASGGGIGGYSGGVDIKKALLELENAWQEPS